MSELAGVYYRERAPELSLANPPKILGGGAIMLAGSQPDALEVVASRFLAEVEPLEPYVLDSVRGIYKDVEIHAWEGMRAKPSDPRTPSLARYVNDIAIAPAFRLHQ